MARTVYTYTVCICTHTHTHSYAHTYHTLACTYVGTHMHTPWYWGKYVLRWRSEFMILLRKRSTLFKNRIYTHRHTQVYTYSDTIHYHSTISQHGLLDSFTLPLLSTRRHHAPSVLPTLRVAPYTTLRALAVLASLGNFQPIEMSAVDKRARSAVF